jgi:glycosyltransferase involved in cell wall biosynthesis
MFRFRDKIIYIISPENWGAMKVSKHHYAMALADRGNRVFFIEPPRLTYQGVSLLDCPDHAQITLVRYRPLFRGRKYIPEGIYQLLIRWQVRRLLSAINALPDAVICFHGYLFEDLRLFRAPVRIFFAADQFYYDHIPPETRTASLNVGVSDTICDRIRKEGVTVQQINHGLHHRLVEAAKHRLQAGYRTAAIDPGKVVVGFTGNLRMEALDRDTMRAVIEAHPEVQFVCWGSYRAGDLNLGGLKTEAADEFVAFLEARPNVQLRGVVDHETLHREMDAVDIFWLCWKLGTHRLWDGSNSHKLLEYLSTGRPVVSHHVSAYRGNTLLYMQPGLSNEGYAGLFNRVLDIVRQGEAALHVRARLEFAVANGYDARLQELEEWISHG